VPPTCEMPWDELAQRSQRAALLLGYTRDEWETERLAGDEEGEVVAAGTPPITPPLANARGAHAPVNAPPAVTTDAGGGGVASGMRGKDKGWAEMLANEQAAAKVLGYDGTSWDEGEVPPTCEMPWDELAQRSQRAALLLGYTRDEWETERLAGDEEDA